MTDQQKTPTLVYHLQFAEIAYRQAQQMEKSASRVLFAAEDTYDQPLIDQAYQAYNMIDNLRRLRWHEVDETKAAILHEYHPVLCNCEECRAKFWQVTKEIPF